MQAARGRIGKSGAGTTQGWATAMSPTHFLAWNNSVPAIVLRRTIFAAAIHGECCQANLIEAVRFVLPGFADNFAVCASTACVRRLPVLYRNLVIVEACQKQVPRKIGRA